MTRGYFTENGYAVLKNVRSLMDSKTDVFFGLNYGESLFCCIHEILEKLPLDFRNAAYNALSYRYITESVDFVY